MDSSCQMSLCIGDVSSGRSCYQATLLAAGLRERTSRRARPSGCIEREVFGSDDHRPHLPVRVAGVTIARRRSGSRRAPRRAQMAISSASSSDGSTGRSAYHPPAEFEGHLLPSGTPALVPLPITRASRKPGALHRVVWGPSFVTQGRSLAGGYPPAVIPKCKGPLASPIMVSCWELWRC